MPGTTILIVDGDANIRRGLGSILEKAGYTVRLESSGAAAITSIESNRPDLVMTDIEMPGIDGITFLGKIKEIDNTIPVIVLTVFGSVETAVDAMKLGAIDYLTKPIHRDELTLTVEKTLRMRRLEKENKTLKETVRKQLELVKKEQIRIESPYPATLPELERRAVIEALIACNWNQSKAARHLGIPRHVLLYRMKKYNIHRNWPDND